MLHFDEQLETLVRAAWKEDIGAGDQSTLACIPPDEREKAVLRIKEEGILAGVSVAEKRYSTWLNHRPALSAKWKMVNTCSRAKPLSPSGATVHTILQSERLVLNCMQRMSGITTLTRQYADKLKGYHTRILDTRKTTPNFRLLEKKRYASGAD